MVLISSSSQIASVVAGVYSQGQMYVSVHIDMKAIKALQLEVTLESISHSIATAPRLKIKAGVRLSPSSMPSSFF